ncbi:hypothetical protein PanWU01x14_000100 [Parasponia andersonii]|uniref:Uncharacterized protein n=1 Tax=Parasponia andersonii TaxID=3476 RepID=A0A2P5E4H2_PARAD|nr:hypothetical protein PanWU01x14_000100 [Parasponia andersonii]
MVEVDRPKFGREGLKNWLWDVKFQMVCNQPRIWDELPEVGSEMDPSSRARLLREC